MPPSLVALNFRVWKNSVNDVYLVDLSECDNLYLSFGSSIEFIYRELVNLLVNLLILLGICGKTLRDKECRWWLVWGEFDTKTVLFLITHFSKSSNDHKQCNLCCCDC